MLPVHLLEKGFVFISKKTCVDELLAAGLGGGWLLNAKIA